MLIRRSPLSSEELSNLLGRLPDTLSAKFKLRGATDSSDLSARFPMLKSIGPFDIECDAKVERGTLLELYTLQLQDTQPGVSLELLTITSRGENYTITVQPTNRELDIRYESPMPPQVSEILKYLPDQLKVELYQSAPSPEPVFAGAIPPPPRELREQLKSPQASEVIKISVKIT
ncbi:MAG: hypothetical protein HYT16_04300 [DPANN group archaeon]|nr:hypothetical protein [DPANN group archaeon]